MRMFRQYKVQVGISIDGPGEFNDVRWAGTLERKRENTAKTEAAIERLCREGMPPSLIVTLHRGNATPDKLPVLHDWFRRLAAMGISSARLHDLEVEGDDVGAAYALSTEENLVAWLRAAGATPGQCRDVGGHVVAAGLSSPERRPETADRG